MKKKKILFVFLAMLISCGSLLAQVKHTITGVVTDADGKPVPGVTITVKGTATAVSTDENGHYSIQADNSAVLEASSVGYVDQDIKIGGNDTVNITLVSTGGKTEGEVVVTALGIKRERKSLGYAVQEVKGQALVEAREPNLVNDLSGKVAGLQVVRSGNGVSGSSQIVLRGNNSLSGLSQPLIVVDGIPISNATGRANNNNDFWNPTLDMGNGLSDINADDIESISVLKGPAAAGATTSAAGE